MCGGEGTRLRPLTFERPKPCIPIVNTPSIVHLVSHLSNLGFNDIVVTLGYMGEKIVEALGDGSLFGAEITYVWEEHKLGTAGSVKNAQKYLEETPFLVVGGDHVADINLLEMYRDHIRDGSLITIGFMSIDDPQEYGIAQLDVNNTILRWKEKPAPGEIFSNLASTGMYVCNPEIFDYIPAGEKYDFARNLFPRLMEEKRRLCGWFARGHWTDVGSPRSLREAEKWKLQDIPYTSVHGDLNVRNARITGPVSLGGSLTIGDGSRVVGPVSIGAGTVIEENVLIGPYTSIGEDCVIRENTQIFSSSIYNGVVVGRNTTISGSIIDNDTIIGDGCSVENDTVIGPRVRLKNNIVIHSGVRIWPDCSIEEGSIVKEHVLNERYDIRWDGS
ncbi:MAG: nucleotidyltransferase family protein [Methanoculleaceae archaeon]